MKPCKICGNIEGNRQHSAREMMFGMRETFAYLECGRCGCVQLLDIPSNLGKYYPSNYYSFQKQGRLKTYVRHQWAAYAYGRMNPLGYLATKFFMPNDAMISIRREKITAATRILDVGCGSGNLIHDLWYLGFRNVSGADPFIEKDIPGKNGPAIWKKDLTEMTEQFDVIMLHHSFEHMDDPAGIILQIARLLSEKGVAIIRIPIASSFAWKHYGVNWIHLDAPRHLYLHTVKSMEILTSRAGLEIQPLVYDSNDSTFWGSEQYLKDIPLMDAKSYAQNRSGSIFSKKQIQEFKAKVADLNARGEGDFGCFYLRKKSSR